MADIPVRPAPGKCPGRRRLLRLTRGRCPRAAGSRGDHGLRAVGPNRRTSPASQPAGTTQSEPDWRCPVPARGKSRRTSRQRVLRSCPASSPQVRLDSAPNPESPSSIGPAPGSFGTALAKGQPGRQALNPPVRFRSIRRPLAMPRVRWRDGQHGQGGRSRARRCQQRSESVRVVTSPPAQLLSLGYRQCQCGAARIARRGIHGGTSSSRATGQAEAHSTATGYPVRRSRVAAH